MLEYMATYDLFAYGLYGSAIGMVYFIAIALASTIPYVKKPLHKTLEILVPVYFIGFLLSFLGFSSILTGLVVIGVYLFAMKHYMGISTRNWLPIVISFAFILGIFSMCPLGVRDYLFAFLVGYIFIQGKVAMRKVMIFEPSATV